MLTLKFALRSFARTPFVTAVAIASLALGIGANSAIFSLFNELLLRPLPVADPAALVNLSAPGPKPGSTSCNQAGDCDDVFSYPMFRDLEREQTVFTGLALHRLFGANLAANGSTLNGQGMLVSGSYFPVLGLQPAIGRLLGPGDDRTVGEAPVAVLSHAYWATHFGSDAGVLGQTLAVNGQPLTIVGVTPEGFEGTTLGAQPYVYVPITLRGLLQPTSASLDDRRAYWAYLFGRLKPGTTLEQAAIALNVPYHAILNEVEAPLQTGMSDQTMERFRERRVRLEAGPHGQSDVHREARAPLLLLGAVTGFVLLIACANIANLLLARAAARRTEIAVRLAIGASRWQLVRQLLVESCLLAVAGGAAGLLVARWTLRTMRALLPAEGAAIVHERLDPRVLLFTVIVALGTGLLFGLFPAWQGTRPDLIASIKGQAGQSAGARSAARFRWVLATAQIALSMALLVSAGLFTKSLFNISRVDLGVSVEHVVTFGVSPALNGYAPTRSAELFEHLEDELGALPGVSSVAASSVALLAGNNWGRSVSVEGFEAGPDTDTGSRYNEVGPGYFHTLGIPILAGREFTRADGAGAPQVAIVNEAFARKFNLGTNPIGRHIAKGRNEALDIEIVGLARDAKYSDVKDPVPPLFFVPYRQDETLGSLSFYVRTALEPEDFLANVPKLVAGIDPNLPVEDLRTMPQQVRENIFLDRFISIMSAAFAALATLLAAIGLYGVLAYTVTQRTREIGVRMALGADAPRVRAMVLRQVSQMTAIGAVLGLGAALAIGRLGQSLLFELEGTDVTVLAGSAVALAAVAFAAGFVPALRASRVDPMRALRYE